MHAEYATKMPANPDWSTSQLKCTFSIASAHCSLYALSVLGICVVLMDVFSTMNLWLFCVLVCSIFIIIIVLRYACVPVATWVFNNDEWMYCKIKLQWKLRMLITRHKCASACYNMWRGAHHLNCRLAYQFCLAKSLMNDQRLRAVISSSELGFQSSSFFTLWSN